ncbi:MAG: Maf family protein, partial [Deltaproteobacteria bacterium]|nr:Maf family protein [Deltaproteobacteria bacterium]
GREHAVLTAFAILEVEGGRLIRKTTESKVFFKILKENTIEEYLSTEESMDKAGAYGLQGEGRKLIKKIDGSETNVIGLPLEEVASVLRGLSILSPTK